MYPGKNVGQSKVLLFILASLFLFWLSTGDLQCLYLAGITFQRQSSHFEPGFSREGLHSASSHRQHVWVWFWLFYLVWSGTSFGAAVMVCDTEHWNCVRDVGTSAGSKTLFLETLYREKRRFFKHLRWMSAQWALSWLVLFAGCWVLP